MRTFIPRPDRLLVALGVRSVGRWQENPVARSFAASDMSTRSQWGSRDIRPESR